MTSHNSIASCANLVLNFSRKKIFNIPNGFLLNPHSRCNVNIFLYPFGNLLRKKDGNIFFRNIM